MTRAGCVSNVNGPRADSEVFCEVSQSWKRWDLQSLAANIAHVGTWKGPYIHIYVHSNVD